MTEWKTPLESGLSRATPETLGKVLSVIVSEELKGDQLAIRVLEILIEAEKQKIRELEDRRLALSYRAAGWTSPRSGKSPEGSSDT